jgi:hypothetical protein
VTSRHIKTAASQGETADQGNRRKQRRRLL